MIAKKDYTGDYMLSSKDEAFEEHVRNAWNVRERLRNRTMPCLTRLFQESPATLDDWAKDLLICHDVGKLTRRWQDEIRKPTPRLPPHSSIGAAFLWKISENEEELKNVRLASTFAILIHHIDKGIIGDNTERPHIQLILYRLVNDDGSIRWHQDAERFLSNLSKVMGREPVFLRSLRLEDVEAMAEDLRIWSRGVGIMERHRHRIMASSLHHILKMCDLRAAANRVELRDTAISPLVIKFVEGGLL